MSSRSFSGLDTLIYGQRLGHSMEDFLEIQLCCFKWAPWVSKHIQNSSTKPRWTQHAQLVLQFTSLTRSSVAYLGWEKWLYHSQGSHLQAWLASWQHVNQFHYHSLSKSKVLPYLFGWPWHSSRHQVHRMLKKVLLKEEGSSAVRTKRCQLQLPTLRERSARVKL